MNSKYFFGCLLLISATLLCKAQVFSGKLDNLNNNELIILTLQDYVYFDRDTVYADGDGNFSIELHLETPGYIWFWGSNFRNESIYLLPGGDLHIEADGTDGRTFWDTQRFTGSAALYNNFTADLQRNEILRAKGFDGKTYQLPAKEFVEYIECYYALRDSIKTAYFNGIPLAKDLEDYLFVDSIHSAYNQVSVWRSYVQFLPKGDQDNFYATYIEPYARQQETDWRYLTSNNYRWFFAAYVRRKFDVMNQQREAQGLEAWPYYHYYEQAPALLDKYLSKPLRRYVAETLLENMSLDYRAVHDSLLDDFDHHIEYLYDSMDAGSREQYYRDKFSGIREFRDKVRAGRPAFPFEMRDTLGNRAALADFSGKLLYIDLWASWCGPCIAEFPAARELEAAFANDDRLVFLAISLDDLEKDWLRGIQQHKPVGEQFWIKGAFKSDFARDYSVSGIPHYLLIDENGNFINYKAPRPTSGQVRDILKEALAKMEQE